MTNHTDDDSHIKDVDVVIGAFLVYRKALKTYDDAKFMHDNSKFTSSIVHSITTIEESQKAIELAVKMRKGQTITKELWSKMKTHKHKLTSSKKFILETLEKESQSDLQKISKKLPPEAQKFDIDDLKKIVKNQNHVYAFFQKIKEKCQYLDWDERTNSWDDFNNLDESKRQDVSYYFIMTAALELNYCQNCIEHAINVMRRDGLEGFAYHTDPEKTILTYSEYRDPKDFDCIKKPGVPTTDIDQTRYARGYDIVKKFTTIQGSINELHQAYTGDLFRNVLILLNKQSNFEMYPHPIIRAVMLCLSMAKNEYEQNPQSFDTEKRIFEQSGDAEETSSGKPTMLAGCLVSCEKGQYTIESFTIKGSTYVSNHKIIESILKTEQVIERHKGKTMPLDAVHEAFSKIGFKLKRLKDSEIEEAIIMAKNAVTTNSIENLSDDMKKDILKATKTNWVKLSPDVRSLIGTIYLHPVITPRTIPMTGHYDPMEKFKVRGLIYETIVANESWLS